MTTITVDELETRTREVIDAVARAGEAVAVTVDGAIVATLAPAGTTDDAEPSAPGMTAEEVDAFWSPWRAAWETIGDSWPEGISAVDAVREQRRG